MARSLPPHPTLEYLKKQAKALLKAHAAGDATACKTLRLLRRFAKANDQEILAAKLALNEAQFALAIEYGFKSWDELKAHVEILGQVRRRLSHWERFGVPEGWPGSKDDKAQWIAQDPEWIRLVQREAELEPLTGEAGQIRAQIASMERCHEHYVQNVRDILAMIGRMRPGRVLDCGEACEDRKKQAASYARALGIWQRLDRLPDDADETARDVFDLLGGRDDEKSRLVRHLIAKLTVNGYKAYADEDEDFEKVESRIQHLEICNYNWRENLRIVLREIAAGRRLCDWHVPDGYNAHDDCPNRIAELQEMMAAAAAWAGGDAGKVGRWAEILGEPAKEKRWLVACLCKNVAAQHEQFGGEKLLAKVQL